MAESGNIGVKLPDGSIVIFHEEELDEEDTDEQDFSGWFCIKTNRHKCPACGVPVSFQTALHRVLVWPESDDPNMLSQAAACKRHGRNPKIIEYEIEFGEALSYYAFEQMGFPAHYS